MTTRKKLTYYISTIKTLNCCYLAPSSTVTYLVDRRRKVNTTLKTRKRCFSCGGPDTDEKRRNSRQRLRQRLINEIRTDIKYIFYIHELAAKMVSTEKNCDTYQI